MRAKCQRKLFVSANTAPQLLQGLQAGEQNGEQKRGCLSGCVQTQAGAVVTSRWWSPVLRSCSLSLSF